MRSNAKKAGNYHIHFSKIVNVVPTQNDFANLGGLNIMEISYLKKKIQNLVVSGHLNNKYYNFFCAG